MVKTHLHVTCWHLLDKEPRSKSLEKLRPPPHGPSPLSIHVHVLPQHAIVESTRRLPKGQRHKRMAKDDHRKQSEKWDDEYKRVYPCEGRWEGEDHLEGLGE